MNLSRCSFAERARLCLALSFGVAYRSNRFRHRRSSRRCRDYQNLEPCWRLWIKWCSWLPLFDFDVQKSAGAGGVTCFVHHRRLPSSLNKPKNRSFQDPLFKNANKQQVKDTLSQDSALLTSRRLSIDLSHCVRCTSDNCCRRQADLVVVASLHIYLKWPPSRLCASSTKKSIFPHKHLAIDLSATRPSTHKTSPT